MAKVANIALYRNDKCRQKGIISKEYSFEFTINLAIDLLFTSLTSLSALFFNTYPRVFLGKSIISEQFLE